MANEFININKIIQLFTGNLVNTVMTDCVHSKNILYSPTGQQVVPVSILDNPDNVPGAYVGSKNTMITSSEVYNGLVSVTKWLLRLGTYSYTEYKTCTGFPYDRTNQWSSSGKALFNTSYATSHFGKDTGAVSLTPNRGNVVNGKLITVDDINNLISNCLSSWNNTNKPHYNGQYIYCHDSCHNSCHKNCHSNYHDNYICYGPETNFCHGCYHFGG